MAKGKMNTALSVTLLLALMTAAPPVTAQDQGEAPAGAPSSSVGTATQRGTPDASGWSRVRQLASGAKIIVTIKGAWTAPRYFVSADDSELVVSNEAGHVDHITRADVAEIKKERSKVLFYVLAAGLSIVLPLVGGAIGHAIQGGEGLGGPLLGAAVVGVGSAVLIGSLYRRSAVIYRAP